MDHPTLAEAKRIADQPVSDRLDGKQGQEARDIMIRLLEDCGMDFTEAIKLVESYGWSRWNAGFSSARGTHTETKEN